MKRFPSQKIVTFACAVLLASATSYLALRDGFPGQVTSLQRLKQQMSHVSTPTNSGAEAKPTKPIPPLKTRYNISALLQSEGFTTGAELGVQRGEFALEILNGWPACEKYYLVDIWKMQENYVDGANVNDDMQNKIYNEALQRLAPFQGKTEVLRMYTNEAAAHIPDNSLDYVYVDARHDYCGCLDDMNNYWPKLRSGGIMAGHDYMDASEVRAVQSSADPNASFSDWGLCMDGSRNEGAVVGAVTDFAAKHGLQVAVTYNQYPWPSWLIRKP